MTWRLVVPPTWGTRGDPHWLPAVGADAWQRVFRTEDLAARTVQERGGQLPWRVAAETAHLLASVLEFYRTQLRVAEDEAASCPHAAAHLSALGAADVGAEPPTRTHPAGPWRVRTLDGGQPVTISAHPSVDGAEGEVVARRTGDASVVCWAEPGLQGDGPASKGRGWQPRVSRQVRFRAFAVEDAIAHLCAGAAGGGTGPDVLDTGLLCLLGQAAWRSICEYRTLMAAIWTDLESCSRADDHERRAAVAIDGCTSPTAEGPGGAWRHVLLLDGGEGVELSVHGGALGAAASVAVDRSTDDRGLHWAEPVAAGRRPAL